MPLEDTPHACFQPAEMRPCEGGEGSGGVGARGEFAHDAQVARQPTRSLLSEEPYRPFSLRLLQLAVH